MIGEHAAVLEDAVCKTRPLPWIKVNSSETDRMRAQIRNVSNLIKVDVPELNSDGCTPWRLELVDADGATTRSGVAKAVGIDGSVGILWYDRPPDDSSLD